MKRVCPQGVISLVGTLTYQQTEQVMETLIGYPFKVQEECCRMPGEFWQGMNIDFACPYCQSLEFDVKAQGLLLRSFAPAARFEQIG